MKSQDADYEDIKIESIKPCESGGYELNREDGFSFFMPECGIIPKAGDTARFYGKGIGFNVRGLDLNGQECFYRTEEEDRQKQTDDVYGKTALDMIQRWDDGQPVWTVEMGGIGPGYEQAIQILMIELIREQWGYPLPNDETWRIWGDNTVSHFDKKLGGFSGAQVNAAKQLALRFLRDGPQEVFLSLKESGNKDRMIQISKHFPSL